MSQTVLWMDSEKAHIFKLKVTGIEKSQVKKVVHDHHTHDKHSHHADPTLEHFFHELALALKDADELLILGPGLGKNHFKNHLEKHHHGDLAKKVVGIENSDHPTDNQILATARKFFTTYNLFNHPITEKVH